MKHCLIIDTSPIVRKVAAAILKDLGLRVEQADSSAMALAHCRIEMPDLIFVDWRLPNGEASLFLDEIESLSRLHQPRVIVWTTVADPKDLHRAQTAGAHDFMLKPFDRRAFLDALAPSAAGP